MGIKIKPDIVEIILSEGIDLRERGRQFWGLCPFHAEKTPSFTVNRDKGVWYCFGCGEGGEVIDFIMKLKDFGFKDAIAYLGLSHKLSSKHRKELEEQKIRKKLIKRFKQWQECLYNFLSDIYRETEKALLSCQTIKQVEEFAWWYHSRPIVEYWLELLNGDEDQKLELYREFRRRGIGL